MSHLIGITGNCLNISNSPRSISGNVLWVDGADPLGTGIAPANGTSITSWKDKSGNGNDMVAQSAATYSANSQNSLGALTFNTSWYRSSLTNIQYYPIDTYLVLKLDSTTAARDVCAISQVGVDNFNSLTFSDYAASKWHNGSTTSSRTINSVASVTESSTSFILIQWSVANANFYIYRNGVQIAATTSYTWTPPASVVFLIGARVDATGGNRYVGKIAEVIAYNSQLDTANRQYVEGYLAKKWGLQSQLPVSHPSYSPPEVLAQVWLDGTDPLNTGAAGTDAAILTTWNDKSIYGRNMVFSGTGTVSYSNASIRGLNTISINLSQGLGTITTPVGLFSNNYCGFIVFRNVSGGNELFATLDASSWAIPVEISGNARYAGVAANNRSFVGSGTNVAGFPNIITLWNFTFTNYASTGGTGVWNEYLNGSPVTVTGGVTTGLNAAHTVSSMFFIGRGSANTQYTGQYCEILVYNSGITTLQRQQIEGYLAWKWGIQASLPVTHPYSAQAPIGLRPANISLLSSSDVPAEPTSVQMSTGGTYVTVSWVPSATAASYTIVFYSNSSNSTSGGTVFQTITGNTGRRQSTFLGLTANVYYYASVQSVNSVGNSAEVISVSAVQYIALQLPPTNVVMGSFSQGQTTISVTWTAAPEATSYTVIFLSNASASTTGGTVWQTITGVVGTSRTSSTTLISGVNGTYYYATVTALSGARFSSAIASSGTIFYHIPRWIPGNIVWLDGNDQVNSAVISGNNVTQWRDKSGLNHHTVTTSTSNPQKTTLNSLNAISFSSGSSHFMRGNLSATYGTSGYTVVSVLTLTNITSGIAFPRVFLVGLGSASTPGGGLLVRNGNRQQIAIYSNNILGGNTNPTGTGTNVMIAKSVPSYASAFVLTHRVTATAASCNLSELTINGDPISGGLYSGVASGNARTFSNYSIANYLQSVAGAGDTYTGIYGEIFVYSSNISETHRSMIEGYLAWKWGTTATLNGSHQYKNAAP